MLFPQLQTLQRTIYDDNNDDDDHDYCYRCYTSKPLLL